MASKPSPEYLAESRQADLIAAVTITYTGALTAVALRFWSRRLKGAKYWLDDWLIVAAQICSTAMLVNIIWWVSRGYGRHREASGPNVDYDFFLGFFMAEIIYTFIVTFVKYAILALYWRVFGKDAIKWPVAILVSIATAWGIAVLFLSIFTCVPPKAFWDKSVKNPRCEVDNNAFLWSISIPNIMTDVALLLLPVPYVMKLSTSWSQKRLILGTFFLGGFVCIASIMRLVSVVRQNQGPDAMWHWVDQGLWAITEGNFAIISACLPTLRPVVNRVFNTSHESAEATSSRMPRIWTIGGSGAPSSRRSRRKIDESLLASTIASTIDESTHRFEAIPESRGVSQESRYSAKPSLRSSVQGHELNDIAKPSSTFTPQ